MQVIGACLMSESFLFGVIVDHHIHLVLQAEGMSGDLSCGELLVELPFGLYFRDVPYIVFVAV